MDFFLPRNFPLGLFEKILEGKFILLNLIAEGGLTFSIEGAWNIVILNVYSLYSSLKYGCNWYKVRFWFWRKIFNFSHLYESFKWGRLLNRFIRLSTKNQIWIPICPSAHKKLLIDTHITMFQTSFSWVTENNFIKSFFSQNLQWLL